MTKKKSVILSHLNNQILWEHLSNPAIAISDKGIILDCNQAYRELYPFNVSIQGKDYFDLCHGACIHPAFLSLHDLLEEKPGLVTETNDSLPTYIKWSASKCTFHSEVIFLLIGMDITDVMRNAEKEKRVTHAIIDALPNHYIFWKDLNSVYLGCNTALAKSLGLHSSDEIVGKTDYDLPTTTEESNAYRADDQEVMASRQSKLNIEETQTLVNGEQRVLCTSKTPLFDKNNTVYGVLAIYSDITKQKRAIADMLQAKAETKQAMIEKNEANTMTLIAKAKAESEIEMRKTVMVLVGNIVHDLRTPLATIHTVADIIDLLLPQLIELAGETQSHGTQKRNHLSQEAWTYLKEKTPIVTIQAAISIINEFINTTLQELKNAQREEFTLDHLTKCSSRRVIENTLDVYPLPHHIILHQDITYDFFLMGNSILMMKILCNLIKNAVEQIILKNKGEITITSEKAGNMNLIKIKDTAGGAPADVVEQFFEGYFTTKPNGTGIGLSFCKNMMKRFGGDIVCHSIDGESIEFVLIFPAIETS